MDTADWATGLDTVGEAELLLPPYQEVTSAVIKEAITLPQWLKVLASQCKSNARLYYQRQLTGTDNGRRRQAVAARRQGGWAPPFHLASFATHTIWNEGALMIKARSFLYRACKQRGHISESAMLRGMLPKNAAADHPSVEMRKSSEMISEFLQWSHGDSGNRMR